MRHGCFPLEQELNMAKFVMECPACKKPVQAGTGLFAKKNIKCSCGYTIHVQAEKLATDTCPHCGNDVVYDRAKKSSATCPVCHARIHAGTERVKLHCPSCRMELTADKNAASFTCPQCKSLIDVQAALAREKSSGKTSVIKWDMGMNDIFVYRHPVENFNIGSQLIVSEGQRALFFRNGKGLDTFGPGRHLLETQRLPLLSQMLDYPTDADLTWDSRVYFIRTNRLSVKWGVPEVQIRNPGMDFYVKFGFSGSCDLQLIDNTESARQLVYMIIGAATDTEPQKVGTPEIYTTDYIRRLFKDVITTRLSDLMTNIIQENGINVLDIETRKNVISELLRKDLNQVFAEYGMVVPPMHFNVTNIRLQDSEEVRRWKQQESARVLKVREQEVLQAEAEAARGRILTEEQTEAQRKLLGTQGAAEELKITAAAKAESLRLGAQAEAEAIRLKGQAGAESYSAQAMAEAQEMRVKGYTYTQETSRQIGLEAMQNGLPGTGGTGGNGGIMGDVVGLGVGLGTMGQIAKMTKDTLSPVLEGVSSVTGASAPADQPATVPIIAAWNCTCGKSCITSKFCPDCGAGKPEPPVRGTWSCACGCSDITSRFCPDCGARAPEAPEGWNCPSCGKTGIRSKFCPDCGYRKENGL